MFHKILVAIDDSELSDRAFEKGVSLAKAFEANLYLVHVLSPLKKEYEDVSALAFGGGYYPEAFDEALRERWQTLEKEGLELLRTKAQQAIAAGVTPEFTQMLGQPGEKICELAQSWDADLIVMGSHGRTGLGEFLMGSVSNHVSHHAPCSVMIVHHQDKQ
ncbi:universal stress protein [Pleurocapsales cyanobacterium LEGE 06147]|nr:universal stress protein [Pleurocapsales cyanobacterium LEGE 06147]